MASKNRSTIPTRTQDTITQQELVELRILQVQLGRLAASREGRIVLPVQLDRLTASCQTREARIAEKLQADALVEPGRFFLAGTCVEVRA